MENSKSSAFFNGLFGFFSTILSIVFVLTAFALVLAYSVGGIIKPKAIANIIQKVDYAQVIKESEDFDKILKSMEIDAQTADEIIKSDAGEALIKDFSNEVTTAVLDEDGDLDDINDTFLKELVDKHADEILLVAEEKNGAPIEKAKLQQELHKAIEKNSDAIDDMVTSLEPVKSGKATQIVKSFFSWQYAVGVWVIEAAILALIYLMKKNNYSGFVWIAVNTGIVGSLISVITLILGSGYVKKLTAELPAFANEIVISVKSVVLTNLTISLAVCFVVMIAAIVACVVLRTRKRNLLKSATAIPTTDKPQQIV